MEDRAWKIVKTTDQSTRYATISSVEQLQGKTVFITGGARRLGRAMALAAAKNGANVAFTYLNSEDAVQETLDCIHGPES